MNDALEARPCPQCAHHCDIDCQYCPRCGFPVGAIAVNQGDPMVGQLMPGGYRILDLLGVGGMGRVYRAEQQTLGRTVAIKVIHPHLLADDKSLVRFLTEARATSQLNHPNTVSVIDFGKLDDGKPYLVMEFLRGQNLAQVQASEGLFELPRIVNVLRQVLLALGEAHALDIIHRDLKPENIVLEPLRRGGDFVKVVDFGLAKLIADGGTGVTMPGIVCGTPDFMSPEQGRGDPIDGRSDLYAVGVVLFWMLTGRLPFESESATQVVLMHINSSLPDPRELVPQREISASLLQVVYKALAKSPHERFQDASEFSDALEASLDGSATAPATTWTLPPGEQTVCPSCQQLVLHRRYCFECGAALPPTTGIPPTLPAELPMLGRHDDLDWLHEALRDAHSHHVLIRILGEPGVGKTRLVREFIRHCEERGHVTGTCRPDSFCAEVTGDALRAWVEKLVTNTTSPQTYFHGLALLAYRELVYGEPNDLPPDKRRLSYVELLSQSVQYAHQRTRRTPILVVDDFHKLDGLTRLAISDFTTSYRAPVLLIAIHPANYNPGWVGDRARIISGLPASVATQLLRHGGPNAARATFADAGMRGIPPLYVEQVLAFGLGGGSSPPPRLADLIGQRLVDLDATERRYTQIIAVLGEQVDRVCLQAVLGRELEEERLERLRAAKLLSFDSDGDRLSLYHPLLREIILHTTPAEVRREWHARALNVYQEHAAPIEVLAEHAYWANDSMTALLLLEQIAARAARRDDTQTEIHALRRGLDLARQELYRGQLDDPLRAIGIFSRRLGDALSKQGDFSDAEGVLQEALDSAGESAPERLGILRSLAEAAVHRARYSDAERYLRQAVGLARATNQLTQLGELEQQLELILRHAAVV